MDNPSTDNFKVLVVGKDRGPKLFGRPYHSYKAATTALLLKLGYDAQETTDITNNVDHGKSSSLINARRWISKNKLRRFEGQKVKVICALDARSSYDEAWVDVMCLIFEKHSKKDESPFVAAVIQNKDMLESNKHLKKFFPALESAIVPKTSNENCRDESQIDVSFNRYMSESLSGLGNSFGPETSNDKLLPLLEHNVNIVLETMDDASAPHLERIIGNLEPFEIKTLPLGQTGKKDVKAWSSEKVIMFGRTGSGKSTVAQMLTKGCLDAFHDSATDFYESCSSDCGSPSRFMASPAMSATSSSSSASKANSSASRDLPFRTFEISSNARGMTTKIQRGEGRGWHVTDTPGFGEAPQGSTVSSEEAKEILKKFVIDTCGIYSHFVYVVKKDRMTFYDDYLWTFFNKVFVGAEENFSVVVTGCTEDLSREDENHLQKVFKGCKNFIYVDFPPVHSNLGVEEEMTDSRECSLKVLEDGLSSLGVADRDCWEGKYSKENHKFIKSDIKAKFKGLSDVDVLNSVIALSCNYLVVRPARSIEGFFQKSKIDENFTLLLPQL